MEAEGMAGTVAGGGMVEAGGGVGAGAEGVALAEGGVDGWSSGNFERLVSRFFFSAANT